MVLYHLYVFVNLGTALLSLALFFGVFADRPDVRTRVSFSGHCRAFRMGGSAACRVRSFRSSGTKLKSYSRGNPTAPPVHRLVHSAIFTNCTAQRSVRLGAVVGRGERRYLHVEDDGTRGGLCCNLVVGGGGAQSSPSQPVSLFS